MVLAMEDTMARKRHTAEEIVAKLRQVDVLMAEAVAYYVHCHNEERRRASESTVDRRHAIEAEIAGLDRQIERAVAAIIQGRITESEAAVHLPALRSRRGELISGLAAAGGPPVVVSLRPAAVDSYLRDLDHLAEVIHGDLAEGDQSVSRVLREMIETVTIVPSAPGSVPGIVVRGELSALLSPDTFPKGSLVGGAGGAG
jgi:hypothetical protein